MCALGPPGAPRGCSCSGGPQRHLPLHLCHLAGSADWQGTAPPLASTVLMCLTQQGLLWHLLPLPHAGGMLRNALSGEEACCLEKSRLVEVDDVMHVSMQESMVLKARQVCRALERPWQLGL